jgi:hypothetical protein
MTLYLQTDGLDDKFQTPSMTYDKIELDIKISSPSDSLTRYILDAQNRTSGGFLRWLSNSLSNGGFNSVTGFVANTRTTIIGTLATAYTGQVSFGSRFDTVTNTATPNNFYSVKFYNSSTLVAWYDMSTGTVNDQSGNGRHATLTGGTWVDDAPSGTVVDSGTFSFTGDTTLTANGSLLINGISTLDANGTLVIDGSMLLNADSSLSGSGSLTADGDILGVSVTANLDAISSLITDGSILVNGGSTLSADTILNAIPSLIVSGLSSLSASGVLTADGTSFDPTKLIISKVNLQGEHKLKTLLTTSQDLLVKLNGEVILTIRLVGDIK